MNRVVSFVKAKAEAIFVVMTLVVGALILNAPLIPSASAAISTTTTNMIPTVEGGFDSAATVGMGILVLLLAVGAIMTGIRIAKGRGK